MITIAQMRAARAMLGLKQQDLASKAHVSMGTLNNIERGFQTNSKVSTLQAIQEVLEAEGIEFLGDDHSGRGIRMKPTVKTNAGGVILIIDDNDIDRELYKIWLGKRPHESYEIYEAGDARQGYDMFTQHEPACIILDFMMYGKNGFQLLVEMRKAHQRVPPIIFVTATPDPVIKKEALAHGAYAYLDKKILTKEKLYAAIDKILT